ncbi:hybrid sensor histidine kinase/response regulator [Paracidovorax avenae]|uniref:hybrid sensor histidine kinase/response regulator n=1 Tax=Paracidovorax avenae TaxID=80867 RepID=UPI000D15B7A0|nr:ATP-binding protein [Paracidovorax avenae]AVS71402.1 hybrid sensor histidine kinase/response regulator [Paracidovorax avenae]
MVQHTESSIPPSDPDEDKDVREAQGGSGRTQGLPGWSERAWPSASLRTYLVAMILAATLPIALLLTYKVSAELAQTRSRLQSVLGHSAAGLAQTVALDTASTVDALLALGRTDALRSGQPSALERWLRQRPPVKPQWHSVFFAGADGRIVFDTARPEGDAVQDAAIEALARRASSERRAALSEAVDMGSAGAEVALAVPVRLAGVEGYVLGARMDARAWQRLLSTATPPEGGFIALVDSRQNVVAAAGHLARGRQLLPTGVERVQARMGEEGIAEPAVAAWRPVAHYGWQVSVGVPAAPIEAAERRTVLSAIATMGACLVLGVALAFLLAWRIAQPLQMLARAQRLPPSLRIPVREIALLRDALWTAQRRDATTRQRLQAKAAEFEALFENTPIGLAFADGAHCGHVVLNPVMRGLLGVADEEDGRETPARIFRGGKELAPEEQPLMLACRLAQPVGPMELEIRVPGRAPMSVVASAVPLLDEQGRPRGALSAVTDITELLQVMALWLAADRKRQEKQSLIDLACEAGYVGFFEYRFRPSELVWTAGQEGLFGRDPAALAAGGGGPRGLRAWSALVHADDRARLRRSLARSLRTRSPRAQLEYRIAAAPDDAPRWLSSRLLLRYGVRGRPEQVVGITVDVTEQKNAERRRALQSEQEQAARRQAEAASRAKDEFLTMLSHELRNPLAAIAAASDVLSTGAGGPETTHQALGIIQRQTQHLASMMRDLLDVSRVLRGSAVLARRPTDLAERVRSVRESLSVGGTMRRHTWTFDLQPAWINGDVTRIEQVIVNLLQNAIKYTPEGRSIDVSVSCPGDEAVLRVADGGDGIDEDLLPHIFDLFRQGERMLDRQDGGLGVGLTLVQHLVKQHGGVIDVATSEDGTVFTVRWPRVAPGSAAAPADAVAMRPHGPARRIVLVEDNADMLRSVSAYLRGRGHTVHAAEDGLDGLVLIIAERPDVAIVDIGLPGVDGYEIALRARAAGYAGRMVAVSGYGQAQDISKARKAGFDEYLIKPITMEQLQNAMDRTP